PSASNAGIRLIALLFVCCALLGARALTAPGQVGATTSAIRSPSRAAVSCTDPRDTTGPCTVINITVTINFSANCVSIIITVTFNFGTVEFVIPFPGTCSVTAGTVTTGTQSIGTSGGATPFALAQLQGGRHGKGPATESIQNGDQVSIVATTQGTFFLTVTRPDGSTLAAWSPPITVVPPSHRIHLQKMTKNGFKNVGANKISTDGLYRFVQS
ncbi:MAG TPA: hypothetical protein VHB98_18210, partial [Chloroflexota bacterium]|nr:hypothetical protein [Chloroflexota bacterium]